MPRFGHLVGLSGHAQHPQRLIGRIAVHDPIRDTIDFAAPPECVYAALTDSSQFSQMTGAPASIGGNVGEAFSCFDGWIEGRHVELVPNERIVQAWRVKDWPPGVFSIVRFDLAPQEGGTRLEFQQAGFPPEHRVHLEPGWQSKYWGPLKNYLDATRAG
jgi:uncharacterized protein YndB with AHSA1/START domain